MKKGMYLIKELQCTFEIPLTKILNASVLKTPQISFRDACNQISPFPESE